RIVGEGINAIMRKPDKGVLLITHYQRLLDYVRPDFVHVLSKGRIVKTGGPELAHQLESEGYEAVAAGPNSRPSPPSATRSGATPTSRRWRRLRPRRPASGRKSRSRPAKRAASA